LDMKVLTEGSAAGWNIVPPVAAGFPR